jgi:hypothetical protein
VSAADRAAAVRREGGRDDHAAHGVAQPRSVAPMLIERGLQLIERGLQLIYRNFS